MKLGRWFVALLLLAGITAGVAYFLPYGKGSYTIEVKGEQTTKDVAYAIASNTNSYNKDLLYASAALINRDTIVPGNYTIKLPAKYTEVWEQVYKRSNEIRNTAVKPKRLSIKATFPEGITTDKVLSILQKNGYTKVNELKTYWTNYNKPLVQKYAFLPPNLFCNYGDINSCVEYFVEGFLYPDTYEFYADEDIESVTQKFLDQFARKNPELINLDSTAIYKKLILASVVEEETGVRGSKPAELIADRKLVSSVFTNRATLEMRWQTDPSVTYGTDKVLCQTGSTVENCSALDDADFASSKYNTYIVSGPPIGPISNPSNTSVTAALNPTDSDYLFFVSDLAGKMYYAKNNAEHNINVNNLFEINKAIEGK
jgi:UPF0755 protein